jgi:uncharacterized membrane protein YeaQ/YmgE (transglycosylase-associated protein family)
MHNASNPFPVKPPARETPAIERAAYVYTSRQHADSWYGKPRASRPRRVQARSHHMDLQSLLILLLVGLIAGWLAGVIVKGYGLGLIGNMVVGVIGAFLAGWLLPTLGLGFSLGNPLVTSIVYATIGAIVLLLIVGLFRRAK